MHLGGHRGRKEAWCVPCEILICQKLLCETVKGVEFGVPRVRQESSWRRAQVSFRYDGIGLVLLQQL